MNVYKIMWNWPYTWHKSLRFEINFDIKISLFELCIPFEPKTVPGWVALSVGGFHQEFVRFDHNHSAQEFVELRDSHKGE